MFELTWLQSWQIQVHTKLIFLWNIKQTDQFHLFSLEIVVLLVMAIFLKGFALINNANLECKMFVMRNENLLVHSTSWRKEHVCFWSFVSEPVSISLCPIYMNFSDLTSECAARWVLRLLGISTAYLLRSPPTWNENVQIDV